MSYPAIVQNMKQTLKGKDFLTISQYTKEELMGLIELAEKDAKRGNSTSLFRRKDVSDDF